MDERLIKKVCDVLSTTISEKDSTYSTYTTYVDSLDVRELESVTQFHEIVRRSRKRHRTLYFNEAIYELAQQVLRLRYSETRKVQSISEFLNGCLFDLVQNYLLDHGKMASPSSSKVEVQEPKVEMETVTVKEEHKVEVTKIVPSKSYFEKVLSWLRDDGLTFDQLGLSSSELYQLIKEHPNEAGASELLEYLKSKFVGE